MEMPTTVLAPVAELPGPVGRRLQQVGGHLFVERVWLGSIAWEHWLPAVQGCWAGSIRQAPVPHAARCAG